MKSRKTRSTGATVSLYRATADLDVDPGQDWITSCDSHGTFLTHATYKLALATLSHPEEWCDECRAQLEAQGNAKR